MTFLDAYLCGQAAKSDFIFICWGTKHKLLTKFLGKLLL